MQVAKQVYWNKTGPKVSTGRTSFAPAFYLQLIKKTRK